MVLATLGSRFKQQKGKFRRLKSFLMMVRHLLFTNLSQRRRLPFTIASNFKKLTGTKNRELDGLRRVIETQLFFMLQLNSKGQLTALTEFNLRASGGGDQKEIQSLTVNHFSSMANSTHSDPSDFLFGLGSSKVSADMNILLTKIPDAKGIRSAILRLRKIVLQASMASQVTYSQDPSISLALLWLKQCSSSSYQVSFTKPQMPTS
ncbi:hypothetical protein AAC387_Pa12g1579 [Persea americana]